MKKRLSISVLLASVGLSVSLSHALTISLTPPVQNIGRGSTVSEVLSLTDFSPNLIGAFSLDIVFDSTLLTFTNASFFGSLGNPNPAAFEAITFTDSSVSGVASLGEVSLLGTMDLAALQTGNLLPLATLTFTTRNQIGTTPLDLRNVVISDANGNPISALVAGARINIIPEPSSFLLFVLGLPGIWLLHLGCKVRS